MCSHVDDFFLEVGSEETGKFRYIRVEIRQERDKVMSQRHYLGDMRDTKTEIKRREEAGRGGTILISVCHWSIELTGATFKIIGGKFSV